MHVLVINCGSSSVKFKVFDNDDVIAEGKVERIGEGTTHASAIKEIIGKLKDHDIRAVGHRVVHGGATFKQAAIINPQVLDAIERCSAEAPLHNPYNLEGIRAAREAYPDVPHVAVFDTAFHARMPQRAYTYALDHETATQHGIRRYGFHGTSHEYVATRAAEYLQQPLDRLRIVSLHLGNGASACAVENGVSVDTSMGLTPLEGLVMGTRCGDIDAGAVLKLLRDGNLSADELDTLLNRQSGLLGVSGVSNDLREIETAAEAGDEKAQLAITVFSHRARKYIGAYAAVMGGVDAIVFTAGIGENSASMRQRIVQRLDFLGVSFNEQRNAMCELSDEQPVVRISDDHAATPVLVVKTDEERMIAQQTRVAARSLLQPKSELRPIPIAVSARHLHLNEETFAALFGEDATPTHYKDISQPGQFACEEKVTLIGPRNKIEGVRLLGPFRSRNQIEISRTDEYRLGVDAPIRNSGRVKGSAPITLEGPKGRVELKEGLICARRHIHMHPDDAEYYGVENGDVVEVKIDSDGRDLTFGDVLIRVSPKYKLEMHIDTDEANAAEITRDTGGALVYTDINPNKAQAIIRKQAS